jgi:hypothetical protein
MLHPGRLMEATRRTGRGELKAASKTKAGTVLVDLGRAEPKVARAGRDLLRGGGNTRHRGEQRSGSALQSGKRGRPTEKLPLVGFMTCLGPDCWRLIFSFKS